MVTAHRRRGGLAMVLFAALAVLGCSTSSGDPDTTAPAPTTAVASPTTSGPPGASRQIRPACANVAVTGQALGATVLQFIDGTATGDQVRAAAHDVSTALADAHSAVQPDVNARLDDAEAAVQRLLNELRTPADVDGVRAAAGNLLMTLGDAVTICRSP